MASAQVLPNSKKREHLEAGKRLLEEFRKKKAADRTKKTATTVQVNAPVITLDQKKPSDTGNVRLFDSDEAGTSHTANGIVEPFVYTNKDDSTTNVTKRVEKSFLKETDSNSPSLNDFSDAGLLQRNTSNYDFKIYDTSGFSGLAGVNYSLQTDEINDDSRIYAESQGRVPYGFTSNNSIAPHFAETLDSDSSSNQSNLYGVGLIQSKENNDLSKESATSEHQTKFSNVSTPAIVDNSIQSSINVRGSSHGHEQDIHGSFHFNDTMNSDFAERNLKGLASGFSSVYGSGGKRSESTGSSSNVWSSSNHTTLFSDTSESNHRRYHSSFLDSLNVTKTPSGMSFQRPEPEESSMFSALKSNAIDVLGTSPFPKPLVGTEIVEPFSKSRPLHAPGAFENSMNFSVISSNGIDLPRSDVNENSVDRKSEFYAPKRDEGFASLEQHIEDLTQEKFSLQRALEASRALAESLAAENSSLTDSYNQQRSVVNQLKSDMEKLQEEIKVHLVELESVKIEYANAQLECNAADERAKLLAAEVIGLEDKALRLRSNELKLERDLEHTHAEVTSFKKKISSLERERQDLQLTISALQEEKKLLQSKIRKTSSGMSIDISRSPKNKKDMATSTEDLDVFLDTFNLETLDTASLLEVDTSSSHLLPEGLESNFKGSSMYIPPDQMIMIQNINSLISDLILEKEELVKALASETSQCSRLKDLNKELSHKLEAQTQRLELLAARNMVNENIPARLPDSRAMRDNVTYADEGDEVVERVLGWIMKLFPGGPSRRRTSKLI